MEHIKIPLPRFLKILTDNGVPMQKAMAIASKIYKEYNTPAKLGLLNEVGLVSSGVSSKEERKLIMSALRQSGHVSKSPPRKKIENTLDNSSASLPPTSKPMSSVQILTTPTRGKRKRKDDSNDLLPDGPVDEGARYGNLVFDEILDEQTLLSKSTVINRAPLMAAWAAIVAERIGFKREEALSIASVYTEMNAISKGVSLGIYQNGEGSGMEAIKGGSQSYVELMGRRPLYRSQTAQWRALSNGSPVRPSIAFSYISRAFRQTVPHIMGSLRLLAASFPADEINSKAWGLYTAFRPNIDDWGSRSEVKCSTILGLRKRSAMSTDTFGHAEPEKPRLPIFESPLSTNHEEGQESRSKRLKSSNLEEYEAALDQEFAYDELDLAVLSQDFQ